MPRTRSIAWSELKIGIIGIIALLLVTAMVVAVGGQGGLPWQRYSLKTRFHDVNGLKSGAVARLNGKEVGKVTAVEFAGTDIEVTFQVSKHVKPLITDKSIATLGSVSLLGEPMLDIEASTAGVPLPEWAYVPADEKASFANMTKSASESLDEVGKVIADIRAGRGTVGRLFADPALYNEMRDLAASASVVAGYLKDGRGTLGKLARDPAAYDQLRTSLEKLNTITTKIDTGAGPLGRLLNDDAMSRSMAATTSNFEQLSGRLSRGEGTAGQLLTNKELYDRFTNVANRLDRVVAGVEGGEGTAGRLVKDQQLYENMNQAASELRTLIAEIRKDPKKYLNVRVSIF
jgi:phospholipid/cholesterol/gamma-HCH transport system substrate-binding protein